MIRTVDVTSSILASTFAGWRGSARMGAARLQPEQTLALYEYEASPYCRLVREALTEFDLDVMVYPCPQGGTRFRPLVEREGGKLQFPFLIDPNTATKLYESGDIVSYLARTYQARGRSRGLTRQGLAIAGAAAATLARAWRGPRGLRARPSRAPQQPLELFSFESSPYSRLVRETLSELELPYLLRNMGKARATDFGPPMVRDRIFKAPKDTSRNRALLLRRAGHVQVPYLIDSNTGAAMFESAKIVDYLEQTYAQR